LAALARGFSDRHFERGEGPGDEVAYAPMIMSTSLTFQRQVLIFINLFRLFTPYSTRPSHGTTMSFKKTHLLFPLYQFRPSKFFLRSKIVHIYDRLSNKPSKTSKVLEIIIVRICCRLALKVREWLYLLSTF